MEDRTFTEDESARLQGLIDQIVEITGPGLDGNLPPALYNGFRRFEPTNCVDGVPVLKGKPSVILSLRGEGAIYPNREWIIGGRVPKGVFDETVTLGEKFKSELGVDVDIDETSYIGRGRMLLPAGTRDNRNDHTINTPASVYAVGIPQGAVDNIRSGDGNKRWGVISAGDLARDESLHPYVRFASAVAIDRIHGYGWRSELPTEFRDVGYPSVQEGLGELPFIPLRMEESPID
ncbi:hypothetical protein CMI47_15385 [Candidatus Pacearchaeota archaeon]|nr:hypothetical protein [Candidatus Pacearchaeota archaeon]|tara:strand:+ start:1301 stop:2002 length:702 start_codon:yes stop_codon:yes gene_type:complete